MKKVNLFVLGLTAATVLSSCAAAKVKFEKFHEKAEAAAEKEVNYTKATLKVNADGEKLTCKYKVTDTGITVDGLNLKAALYTTFLAMRAVAEQEMDGYKYYVLPGFKVVNESFTRNYNSNGYLTSYKDGSTTLTVTWSK